MSYITWEHYSSLYSEVPQEAFDKLNTKAAVKLDVLTHNRASQFAKNYKKTYATEFQKQVYAQIQNTICELVNALYVQETSDMGTGISSVSNDGYTETYKLTTVAEKEAQLYSIVRSGLAGTGLAGVL